MGVDIERVLGDSELSFTKEVSSEGEEVYSVPFDSSVGTFVLRMCVVAEMFEVSTFLRRLDSLSLKTPRKHLLLELLKLNSTSSYARVFLWTSPDDENDWIGVAGEAPLESLTTPSAIAVINGTAAIAEQALQTILVHTSEPQKQLK